MSEAERKGHIISYTPGCLQIKNPESGRTIAFHLTCEGLYAFKVPLQGASFIQTVEENEQMFTPRQVALAKKAQDLYEMIDIVHAEAIFGKELGGIQGKTTRERPSRVITDYIHIPPDVLEHHSEVTLAADIMQVGKILFLISTSRDIQFTTVEKLNNKSVSSLTAGVVKIINLYHHRGFTVRVCLMDNEFEVLRQPLQGRNVFLNICGPNEHVPEIERKIRTIKERVQSILTTLPFNNLPQTIVTGLNVDCEKHCRIPFGGYAQIHTEPKPTNDALLSRTVGGISLGPTGNIQGTYKFLSMLTGCLIQARSFTPLPMPSDIIHAVNAMETPDPDTWQDLNDSPRDNRDDEYYPYPEDDISLDPDANSIDLQELMELHDDASVHDGSHKGVENIDPPQDPEHQAGHQGGDELQMESIGIANSGVPDLGQIENEDLSDMHTNTSNEVLVEPNVDQADESDEDAARTYYITRSGRRVKMRKDLFEIFCFNQQEYKDEPEDIKANFSPNAQTPSVHTTFGIQQSNNKIRVECSSNDTILQYTFTQYSLKQGLKRFPREAKEATIAEIKQLHDMEVFKPVRKETLTRQELLLVLNSIIFIKQKRCGRIKARACADDRPQRALYEKSEASSPTVETESVILTSVIDAAEKRIIGVYEIPGAFLHSKLPDTVYMKVTGTLARFLVAVAPDIYSSFVVTENGLDVIYLLLTRALYGCLKSALQFWKHLSGNLIKRGYTLNPYDLCVANKMIGGSQFTIVWHVDDLKLSHVSEAVMDEEVNWLQSIYGPLVGSKGNQHTYLGMDLDFDNGKLKVTMIPYLQEIIDEFPDEIGKPSSTPAALHLFDESDNPVPLSMEQSKIFHHTVAKVLLAAIRARPDLLTTLSYLTCKVKNPDEDDYKKLKRMLSYIRDTITLPLKLLADSICGEKQNEKPNGGNNVTWYRRNIQHIAEAKIKYHKFNRGRTSCGR